MLCFAYSNMYYMANHMCVYIPVRVTMPSSKEPSRLALDTVRSSTALLMHIYNKYGVAKVQQ
jgi:hypothetical protein